MIMIYRRKWSNPTQDPTISNKQVTYTSTRSGGRKGISTVVTWLRDGSGVWLGDWSGKIDGEGEELGKVETRSGGRKRVLVPFVTWSRSFVVCIRTRLFFIFLCEGILQILCIWLYLFLKKKLA